MEISSTLHFWKINKMVAVTDSATVVKLDSIEKTLDKHDEKLDKLTEIVANLSRIEERSVNQHELLERLVTRLDDIEVRTERIERESAHTIGGRKVLMWLGSMLIASIGILVGYHSR